MATDPHRMKVEDSLKQKYIAKMRNMTYTDLKKFQKQDYAELVFKDIMPLLPDFHITIKNDSMH